MSKKIEDKVEEVIPFTKIDLIGKDSHVIVLTEEEIKAIITLINEAPIKGSNAEYVCELKHKLTHPVRKL